ncbi:MAG: hypothetical protein RJA98_3909 [Pseudomonadota bacterium]
MPASLLLLPQRPASLRPAPALAGPSAVVALALALIAGLGGAAGAPPATLWLLLGAPLCEEIVFRAGLHEALLRRWPQAHPALPITLTALLFATAHALAHPSALAWAAATALPALALGALYQRQRHWLPCAALHALFNLIWLLGAPHLDSLLF